MQMIFYHHGYEFGVAENARVYQVIHIYQPRVSARFVGKRNEANELS